MSAPVLQPVQADSWSTALPDWRERIIEGRSLVPDLPLDQARAAKAVAIFEALRAPDIDGHPTYGEICDPRILEIVAAIFGAFDAESSRRMIREYFWLFPKKNGKTSIAAAVIVTACILNRRPSEELMLLAPTITVAERAFKQAKGIIRLSETPNGSPLEALFSVHDHIRTIRNLNPVLPSEIVVRALEGEVVTGSKAGIVLLDELHELAHKTRAAELMVEIRGGMSHPMAEGFLLTITTQSKSAPAGVFKAELDSARRVRDGKARLPVLPILYELPEALSAEDGWKDPAHWGLVNVHLGRSVDETFLLAELQKAEEQGPGALALFASQHLNVQVGGAAFSDGWSGARHWGRAGDPLLSLEALLEASDVAVIGVDWGGADDLAALAVIGRRASDRMWLHHVQAWARPSVLETRKAIAARLMDFQRAGDLRIVDTPEEMAEEAADLCARIAASGLVPEKEGIGLDAAGVALLLDALEARGLIDPRVVAVPQGWKLTTAIASVPLKLEAGRLRHGAQPIMEWSVANARQELRGSNYVVTKQAAGAAKIDPLMATFNAAMLMFANPVAEQATSYVYSGM